MLCLSEEGALFGDLVRAGVPARCVHLRGRADARGLRAALACARPRPDVVVSRGVNGLVVAAAIARRARAPHVVNEHTPLQADGELLAPHRHQRLITRALAPRVDAVIAVARRQVDPLVGWGYRRERIRVIPNGIQPVEGSEHTARLAGGDGFAVLCVARLQAEKRVERFVSAMADARRSEPRLRGFVAGDGDRRPYIEPLARAERRGDAGRALGRARPARGRRRVRPLEQRRGASHEHPRGDGARAARGGTGPGRQLRRRGRRGDRACW